MRIDSEYFRKNLDQGKRKNIQTTQLKTPSVVGQHLVSPSMASEDGVQTVGRVK